MVANDPIAAYIERAPAERRDALSELRDACRDELTGFSEAIEYGMPAYARSGEAEVAFASQKQYISLYIMRTDVMAAHRDELAGLSVGKGCIRYRKPADIDFDVVRSMLRGTAAAPGPVC